MITYLGHPSKHGGPKQTKIHDFTTGVKSGIQLKTKMVNTAAPVIKSGRSTRTTKSTDRKSRGKSRDASRSPKKDKMDVDIKDGDGPTDKKKKPQKGASFSSGNKDDRIPNPHPK